MRGFAAVMVSIAVLLSGVAGVAAANELEEHLRKAGEADFSGRQILVSYWDGDSAAGLYDVAQIDGMTMLVSGGESVMVGRGRMRSETGSEEGHVAVGEWAAWKLSDRYRAAKSRTTVRLGRPATVVSVVEDGRPRLRMIFDDETGAPLLSEVYDGDGSLYRMAVMVEFSPGTPRRDVRSGSLAEYDMIATATDVSLPRSLAGYWRADAYAGPEATVHAFYTDGLFSFSVFQAKGRAAAGPFEEGARLESSGKRYKRLLDPGAVRVFWNARHSSYVLVGDLPPDHLDQVLGELPAPDHPNLFTRMWRGLFG